MSEHDAKKHRAAMRAKAHRLAAGESGAVDASSFKGEDGGEGYLHADTKMGMRPVSDRAYRRGGKVLGVGGQEARHHGGRAGRKHGGGTGAGAAAISSALADLDIKDVNAKRPKGKDHVGGWAKGGRSGKAGGGPLGGWNAISSPQQAAAVPTTGQGLVAPSLMNFGPSSGSRMLKDGGKAEHPHGKEDRKLAEKLVEHHTPRKEGGGNWIAGAIKHPGALHKSLGVPEGKKIPEKKLEKAAHSDNPKTAKRARLAETLKGLHKADGGEAVARAHGGKVGGKGKTNISIIIGSPRGENAGAAGMGGQPPVPPPVRPMVPPAPAPAAAGAAPGGAAPMPQPAPGAMAGPAPMAGPMPRARGGAVADGVLAKPGKYPIKHASGGGKGRREKAAAYGAGPTPPAKSV